LRSFARPSSAQETESRGPRHPGRRDRGQNQDRRKPEAKPAAWGGDCIRAF
jgi:hypothetical protein